MVEYAMPADAARDLLTVVRANGASVCVGGGWGVDALVGEQTREHADLDLWVEAADTEKVFAAFVDCGVDRIYPWPGDRPWNFVVHDSGSRRVDLRFYETFDGHRLRYGNAAHPFIFEGRDLPGRGEIAGMPVRCETPEFALANHAGYELCDTDRHDIATLCDRFDLPPPQVRL